DAQPGRVALGDGIAGIPGVPAADWRHAAVVAGASAHPGLSRSICYRHACRSDRRPPACDPGAVCHRFHQYPRQLRHLPRSWDLRDDRAREAPDRLALDHGAFLLDAGVAGRLARRFRAAIKPVLLAQDPACAGGAEVLMTAYS